MPVYHKILAPLDTSELAERVLDTALATASWSGAELILLHVEDTPASIEPDVTDNDLDVIDGRIDELLAAALARAGEGIALPPRDRIRAEVRAGNVVDAIAASVRDNLCDLVVMGTHGRTGWLEAFTGSTTEQALRKVPASVFVVRPHGYPYLRD